MQRDFRPSLSDQRFTALIAAALVAGIVAGSQLSTASADDANAGGPPAAQPAKKTLAGNETAAIVGGKPVYVGQVDQMFAAATHGRELTEESATRMKAAILLELVDRQLVQNYLDKAGSAATADDIEAEMTHLKTELDRSHRTLAEFLAKTRQSEAMLRADVSWRLSWQKFLKSQLTDAALETFFSVNHQQFDGTELRVSHVLFRPNVAGSDAAVANLVREAQEVRKQISSGQITFEAAAEKYSAGPSRHRGGDLGFIPRHGIMVEPFSKAAFALKKGEISEPVISTFGVHLIRVTDVRPGDKSLADVRDAVRQALVENMFERIVAYEIGKQPIQYTGRTPYFKPGTTELVKQSQG